MSSPDNRDADKSCSNPIAHQTTRQKITSILLVASFLLIVILMVVVEKVIY
jgi:predicted nucleic acid-binding Zn ribbon protein